MRTGKRVTATLCTGAAIQVENWTACRRGQVANYGVNAFGFTNPAGKQQFGRSQIHPVAQEQRLDGAEVALRSLNYLFEELAARLKSRGARFRSVVRVAGSEDPITGASQTWADTRSRVELGTIEVPKIATTVTRRSVL